MKQPSETELEALERWALGRARQELAPDAERVARIQTALGAHLGLLGGPVESTPGQEGSDFAPGSGPDTTPPSTLARALSSPFRAAILAGIAGIGLGLGLGISLGLHIAQRDPADRTREVQQKPASEFARAADGVVQQSPRGLETSETSGTSEEPPADGLSIAPAARLPLNKKAHRPEAAPQEPLLYQELAYLRRAQQAMKEGNFAQALGLMVELQTVSPKGSLLSEREVTEVLALCALGRTTEAQSVATRLRARDKNLAYGNRLNSSCVSKETREPK